MVGSLGFPLFLLFSDCPLKSFVFLASCMVYTVVNLQKNVRVEEESKESAHKLVKGLELASGKIVQ